jgi:hypothetical protein
VQFTNGGIDEELEEILLDDRTLLRDDNIELEDFRLLEEITELEDFRLLEEITELEDFRLLEEITELEDFTLLEEITELDDFTLLDELMLLELLLLDALELVFPRHLTPFSKNSVGLVRVVPLGKDRLKPKLIDWLVLMLPFHAAFLTRTDCPVWVWAPFHSWEIFSALEKFQANSQVVFGAP